MAEGEKHGFETGLRKTLLDIINLWMSVKFGNECRTLFDKIEHISDLEALKKVKNFVMKASSLKELEELIKDLL